MWFAHESCTIFVGISYVSGVHGYLSLTARKSAATKNVLCQFHQWLYDATCKLIYLLYLLSVASKSGHKTKTHVLIGCQTWQVLPPDIIWSLTAVKANCHAKGKYCCLYAFDQGVPLIFHFSQLSGIFLTQKQHICLQKSKLKFLQRIFCWAKTNQVDNSRLLQTSNVWQQNMSCLHPIRTHFFLTCYTHRCNRQ